MASHSTISVYDDLTACQSAVSVRSADYKTSGWIHKELGISIYHISRDRLIKYVFLNILMDLLLSHLRIMLCRKYNSIQTNRSVILVIFYSNLGLSIRSQIWQSSILSYLSKLHSHLLCQRDRIWHQCFCLIRSITEHHTLISCSDSVDFFVRHGMFFCFQRLINTHSNICRLLIQCYYYTAGICVKSIFATSISNLTYRVTYDLLNIHISFCCNLSHDHNQTCRSACLTCHTAHWILFHKCIQDRI